MPARPVGRSWNVMTEFQENFLKELGALHRAPFLFIGSGVSRRYINAENWEELLKKFCGVIGLNYNQLKASANGVLPAVATELADKMFDHWWSEDQFEVHRAKYEGPNLKRESCLKIEISEYLEGVSATDTDDGLLQAELTAFAKVVVDGIITTNYDRFLERIFSDFKPYIGQSDLLFSDPQGVGEIYKIHGCCSKPESLVLTQADYADFNRKNPYLAAKLLTIFTEHPVIFMGYSVNDDNVQAILESIVSCLDAEGLDKLSNRLIMVQWNRKATEPILSSHSFSFHGKAVPYRRIECASFLWLFEALGSIKRKMSPKLLRHLRESIYELVKTNEAVATVFVRDIDADTDVSDTEIVIGVGAVSTFRKGMDAEEAEIAQRGYKTYTQTELVREYVTDEVLSSNANHCKSLIEGTLPILLKGATHIPIFRYLRFAGYLEDDGSLKEDVSVDEKVSDSFVSLTRRITEKPTHFISKAEKAALPKKGGEFSSWLASMTVGHVLNSLYYVPKNIIELDTLKKYLLDNVTLLQDKNSSKKANYLKCVGLYDYLRYGRDKIMAEEGF
jgi:hypothetical protein